MATINTKNEWEFDFWKEVTLCIFMIDLSKDKR